ncbi:4-(cytidine 5'-diphospho)-2-C-methyl-D-erythritol kinase [Denitratisoma sp. agr-D3]
MTPAPDWHRTWPAPAKINLFLHVVGRRDDGYHLLQTVFRFVDRCDLLRFSPRSDGRIVLTTPLPGVPAEQDLTVRAALALQAASGCRQGADITLEKHLPMGGGLGGGSSDAATTLVALNSLWGCGLSRPQLEAIGLGLGADVPVFVHGCSTFAEGVGERFTDVTVAEAWYLILVPPVAVPTPTIFRDPELRRNTPPIVPADWQPDFGGNDLEPVACRLYPEVARHLAWLRTLGQARRAAMSGSGACCFAEFATAADAEAALAALPTDMAGFVARGLHKHPLLG